MAMGKAAGMDNWPPEGVRPLPDALLPSLADLFKWCEAHAVWPTPWTRVRTQLCPKNNAPEKDPGAYRPIAILSTWFRLWSRWRLLMTTPDILDRFPPELCGGLPNRSPQGRMLTFMLTIEQLTHDVAHGHRDKQLLFVSLDASKCFDRVEQCSALETARQLGLPLAPLRGIAGHMRQLARHLSCRGVLDPNPIVPTAGLLQGDPYSVVICNVVVMTWVRAMHECNMGVTAYIDDRLMFGHDETEMRRAWLLSREWERQSRWELNIKKTTCGRVGCKSGPKSDNPISAELTDATTHRLLGQEVVTQYNSGGSTIRDRRDAAQDAALKVSLLGAPVPVAQTLVQTVIIPKFLYGIFMQPPP